jgi:hypothetical protein
MANEDAVLEEAMDNLKEAGQRIRATQGLMRSEGMTDCENYRDLPYASLYGARHDRSRILRGPASEGSLASWQHLPMLALASLSGVARCCDDPNALERAHQLSLAQWGRGYAEFYNWTSENSLPCT